MVRKDKEQWVSEDPWKAVVLAEDFEPGLAPVTTQIQKSLVPVANIPLLEYVLECLSAAGVVEVYICVKDKAEQIEEYIQGSRWSRPAQTNIAINVVTAGEALCQGDVMRHVYSLGAIRANFLLINGDVITNMKFSEAMQEHTERVKKDSRNVITTVLKEVEPEHHARSLSDDLVTCLSPTTGELLAYKNDAARSVGLGLDVFEFNAQVDFRADLVNPHVYVCSPLVLELFCDNFDYQDMNDFLRGLIDDDVQGNRIFTHIIAAEYCTRVNNWHTYGTAQIDVLQRWAAPCGPDNSLMAHTQYTYRRGNIYIAAAAQPNRTAHLGRNIAVGSQSNIATECRMDRTVIGTNCSIGPKSVLTNAFVWNNVHVGGSCRIDSAVICSGAVLGNQVTIQAGVVIGPGVRVSDGETVTANTILTVLPKEAQDDDDFSSEGEGSSGAPRVSLLSVGSAQQYGGPVDRRHSQITSKDIVGVLGLGRVWKPKEMLEDSDDDEGVYEYPGGPCAKMALVDIGSCTESDGSDSDDYDYEPTDGGNKEAAFYKEVLESVRRAVAEKLDMNNVVVEINSSKHAYNVTPAAVLETVVKATLEDAIPYTGTEMLNKALEVTKECMELLENYVRSPADQQILLDVLEDYCELNPAFVDSLQKILTFYYNKDLLEEESILSWYHDTPDTDIQRKMRVKCKSLVEWLEAESSEEESEEDESE